MRRVVTWFLCLAMAAGLWAVPAWAEEERTELAVWVCPVGRWADEEAVEELTAAFEQDRPDVQVTVTYLEEAEAESRIDEAILSGQTPDLVVGGTEQLRARWGSQGELALEAYITDPAPESDPDGESVQWSFGSFDNGGEARAEAAKAFVEHVCAAVQEDGAQVITEEMLASSRRAAERRLEERGGC